MQKSCSHLRCRRPHLLQLRRGVVLQLLPRLQRRLLLLHLRLQRSPQLVLAHLTRCLALLEHLQQREGGRRCRRLLLRLLLRLVLASDRRLCP